MIYIALYICRCSSMAERTLPKPDTRVRFPSPAPIIASLYGLFFLFGYCITKKAQSQYGAASFGHNRTKKIEVLQKVPLSLFLTVFNEFKVKNCVFLNLLFLFYLRSLPLDVCIYTFGSRTKISAPKQASPGCASH